MSKQANWVEDYELPDENHGMYVYVDNHVIVIDHGDDYTSVDIYKRGFESRGALASAYADHEEDEQ